LQVRILSASMPETDVLARRVVLGDCERRHVPDEIGSSGSLLSMATAGTPDNQGIIKAHRMTAMQIAKCAVVEDVKGVV
jgi:hypothetical protein